MSSNNNLPLIVPPQRPFDSFYLDCAKQHIQYHFFNGNFAMDDPRLSPYTMQDILGYDEDSFQIVIYEPYHVGSKDMRYDFAEMFRLSTSHKDHFDFMNIDSHNLLVLRGQNAISHFATVLGRYENSLAPQKGSPLDEWFLTCGRVVKTLAELPLSYRDALDLLGRRFFCRKGQHCLKYGRGEGSDEQKHDEVYPAASEPYASLFTAEVFSTSESIQAHLQAQVDTLVILIQTFHRERVSDLLELLEERICNGPPDTMEAKRYLLDLYMNIKEKIENYYKEYEIPFPLDSTAVQYILNSEHCYQVKDFLLKQVDLVLGATGLFSRDSIIDILLNYVDHNYAENITLDNISPIFGYNSSYLGKLFYQKTGKRFTVYLDDVRITQAKAMLTQTDLPVYRIAVKAGYRNVDYFHVKFKDKTGMSPNTYRKEYNK